jgi:hypothetical protein
MDDNGLRQRFDSGIRVAGDPGKPSPEVRRAVDRALARARRDAERIKAKHRRAPRAA